ncbi:MAG: hypothetical protein LBJ20_04035 [Candidatus Methanoplasma sp.]|jgi:hypothetical protein|nr:hypothetical protein [Candidatus Methanoplasma sp.]
MMIIRKKTGGNGSEKDSITYTDAVKRERRFSKEYPPLYDTEETEMIPVCGRGDSDRHDVKRI